MLNMKVAAFWDIAIYRRVGTDISEGLTALIIALMVKVFQEACCSIELGGCKTEAQIIL